MSYIELKYAALVFQVSKSALWQASARNSTRYTYTKFQNKLLFKVTNSQLSIALNKGLIDANTPVYNDDLTLIQDFFKTNLRRVDERERNKRTSSDTSSKHTPNDDFKQSKISDGLWAGLEQCEVFGGKCTNPSGVNADKYHGKGLSVCTQEDGANKIPATRLEQGARIKLGKSKSTQRDTKGSNDTTRANDITTKSMQGAVDGVFYSVDDKLCNNDLHCVIKNGEEIGKSDNSFGTKNEQGELNANNKENSSDIRNNCIDGKEDARDREARARIYESVGCDDTRPTNAGESKGARELTQTTCTLLSTTKKLSEHSSSKASNTNETSTLNECLNERNIVGNYALLNTSIEELAAANEKALILSKIERRVANNESIKSICNELNISRMQYYRMLKAYKEQGLAGLVDKRTTAKDSKAGEIIPDILKEQAIMIWRACGAGGINYAQMHESLHNYAGMKLGYDYKNFLDGKVEELFSVKTLIAFMNDYKRINHLEASIVEKGLDKTKSYKQPALGNSKNRVSERNDMWEIDSSPLDCMLQDKNGVEFRPHILSVVDVYSGRMVCALGDVSNALSLVRLLWKAIDTMGLPMKIKGDNGKDYLSNHFQSVINRLGITYDFTAPYSGELKPFVERAFKTIQHSVISLLPGYLGHNLATREIIEQRTPKKERKAKNAYGKVKKTNQSHLMDFSEAEQVLDTAVNKWNIISNKRVKNRISRIDAFNSCDNPLIKMTYEYFLARAGELYEKKVQKKGININSRTYISCDMPSVGTSIKVVTNIDNISEVYVYDEKFNFICIARDNTIAELSAEELKAIKKDFNKECQAINKVIKDTNISEFTKLTLEHDKKVIKQLHEEKLKDETIILRDDEASKNYKEKGKLLKEVSSCSDYTAPKIQTKDDEDEMSYEDLIKLSNIG